MKALLREARIGRAVQAITNSPAFRQLAGRDLRVALVLAVQRADGRDLKTLALALDAGASNRSVYRSLKRLEAKGIIRKKNGGTRRRSIGLIGVDYGHEATQTAG